MTDARDHATRKAQLIALAPEMAEAIMEEAHIHRTETGCEFECWTCMVAAKLDALRKEDA